MDIRKSQAEGRVVFELEGRLDSQTAPEFQNVLLPAFDEAMRIELDLGKLAYISSAGLRVLLLGVKLAKEKNCVMSVVSVKPEVMEIFEVTGFKGFLNIVG